MTRMKRVLVTAIVAVMALGCFAPSAFAASRDIDKYYFYMTNSNESDGTGVFNNYEKTYVAKVFAGKPAAINCDTYSNGTFKYKSTLNYDTYTRATTFEWLDTGLRREPTYIRVCSHYCEIGAKMI